jgi:hypothetical protein
MHSTALIGARMITDKDGTEYVHVKKRPASILGSLASGFNLRAGRTRGRKNRTQEIKD